MGRQSTVLNAMIVPGTRRRHSSAFQVARLSGGHRILWHFSGAFDRLVWRRWGLLTPVTVVAKANEDSLLLQHAGWCGSARIARTYLPSRSPFPFCLLLTRCETLAARHAGEL